MIISCSVKFGMKKFYNLGVRYLNCKSLIFTVFVEYCRAMLVDHLDRPQQDVWIAMLTHFKPMVVV